MNLWDLFGRLENVRAGLARGQEAPDVVVEANSFTLDVDHVETRDGRVVIVAAPPSIEQIRAAFDRISTDVSEAFEKRT